jgi:murein DD-endopeptidase MepM/ murein hydrolase activator NlpD
MARATRGPEATELPVKPFGLAWSPTPREGHAFAVRIYERPTGRKPVGIEGTFAGRAVRFARYGPSTKWLGIGAVPIGQANPSTLALTMRFDDGTTFEQSAEIAVAGTRFPSTNLSVAPQFSSPPEEVLERIRRESAMVRAMLARVSPEWLMRGEFQPPRPIDVTSPFGQARMFNGELSSRHTGLDLRGRTGETVKVAGRGRVAFAGNLYFAGNVVYVDHGLGVYSGYYHLSRIDVAEGDLLEAGDQVGLVGATGRVTAAHLHWYLAVDGIALDAGSLLEMKLPD